MSVPEENLFVGVDVGTGSVRAALVTSQGNIKNVSSHPLQIWNPRPGFYEQSSDNIWNACCMVVQTVTQGVDKDMVKGVGFDATCSLVVLDKDFKPITVSLSGNPEQNVIMWMDHRAQDQANRINATKHEVLKYVGGKVSLEMDMPKLLCLKESLHSLCWDIASNFFSVCDFMTWKATGSLSRSLCGLTCKFNYQASPDGKTGWDDDFLTQIGLEDLIEKDYGRIGSAVFTPGKPCGSGLSQKAALELGLNPGTSVGTGILDAHAGAIGCIGCNPPDIDVPLTSKLGMICGTSTCHMILSEKMLFVPGVWGPYYSAIVPELWNHEAGQSAAGKLIDHVIETHPAYREINERAISRGSHVHSELNEILVKLSQQQQVTMGELTSELHMWPDFHGNRSPIADSTLRGMVCGLSLTATKESLALLYLATIQALAYGTRHIMDVMKTSGYQDIQIMCACGGLSKNPVYIQMHADIVGLPFLLPRESESVVLGSAILGAIAAEHFPTLKEAMKVMCGTGEMINPDKTVQEFHNKKYRVFLKMLSDQQEYQKIMKGMQI